MSFNEMNTIENALRDHLVGKPVTAQTGMVAEETAEYIAGNRDLKWKYVHGENLVLYGKQPQDVFVDTWLKEALCRLNKPLAANSDLADEVIHRLRGVLLEAGYSGLIRAIRRFYWRRRYNRMPTDYRELAEMCGVSPDILIERGKM